MKLHLKKVLGATTLTLSSLGLAVVPAVASSASAGTSLGAFNAYNTQSLTGDLPLCIRNSSPAVLTLNNWRPPSVPLVDATTSVATITFANSALQFNPAGTFTAGTTCQTPGSATGTLSVSGEHACSSVAASYLRVGDVSTITANAACNGYTWRFEANQQPCFPTPPTGGDTCDSPNQEWVGVYESI